MLGVTGQKPEEVVEKENVGDLRLKDGRVRAWEKIRKKIERGFYQSI